MTIGILSWGAHETLEQTLDSYRFFGLDKLDNDRIIFFQNISDSDFEIARKYDWMPFGSSDNIGIAGGYQALVNAAEGDEFLFLENDWKLLERPHRVLSDARFLLHTNQADIIRLRHRSNPGYPLWTLQFQGHEDDRPTHLLDSVHWVEYPDAQFPGKIRHQKVFASALDTKGTDWYLANAHFANWTNNPHMAYTSFLKQTIVPLLSGDIERNLQGWWEQQDYIVAQGSGLFQHNRID